MIGPIHRNSVLLATLVAAGLLWDCSSSSTNVAETGGAAGAAGSGASGGSGGGTGGSDASTGGTAGGGTCDPLVTKYVLEKIPGLNTTVDEEGMTLTPNELVAVFASERPATFSDGQAVSGRKLYMAERGTRDASWGKLRLLEATALFKFNDTYPSLSSDGMSLFFASDRANGQVDGSAAQENDLYVSRRSGSEAEFLEPASIGGLDDPFAKESTPFNVPDSLTVVFSRNAGGDEDLFSATVSATAKPPSINGAPEPIPGEVNSASSAERSGVLVFDSTRLYFASNRAGSFDVYVATRPNGGAGFGEPVLLPELSGPGDDFPTWVSPDGCRIYVTRPADAANPDFDLWVASAP